MFKKGDFDAYLGVLFDGITKIITGVIVLTPVLGAEVVFGQLMPSIGLAILFASIFFLVMAKRLTKKTSDKTITAMPGGIPAGRFFIWLFAIMIPTYQITGDAVLTLFVGIGANILGSIFSIGFAFIGERVMKIIPAEILFGSLAGGAVSWLLLSPFNDMMVTPFLAIICTFLVLGIYVGNIKTPVSPAILSIILGTVIGFLTGIVTIEQINEASNNFGFYIPGNIMLTEGYLGLIVRGTVEALKYLPIIIAFSIGETVSNIQAMEQASSVGHDYDKKEMLVGLNLVSLASAFFGNPFCLGMFWGYPTWKERKSTPNYMILHGATYLILGMTGIIAVVTAAIPIATVLPILVFIGMISAQNAFADADKKYFGVMILCLSIPVMEWGLASGENLTFMANGAVFTSLVWGCIFYFIINRNTLAVFYSFASGAILSFLGLMHTQDFIFLSTFDSTGAFEGFKLVPHLDTMLLYLGLGITYVLLVKCNLIKYEEM